jgi:hypothetical protein
MASKVYIDWEQTVTGKCFYQCNCQSSYMGCVLNAIEPASPTADQVVLYSSGTPSKLYLKASGGGGTVTQLGGSGGGGPFDFALGNSYNHQSNNGTYLRATTTTTIGSANSLLFVKGWATVCDSGSGGNVCAWICSNELGYSSRCSCLMPGGDSWRRNRWFNIPVQGQAMGSNAKFCVIVKGNSGITHYNSGIVAWVGGTS